MGNIICICYTTYTGTSVHVRRFILFRLDCNLLYSYIETGFFLLRNRTLIKSAFFLLFIIIRRFVIVNSHFRVLFNIRNFRRTIIADLLFLWTNFNNKVRSGKCNDIMIWNKKYIENKISAKNSRFLKQSLLDVDKNFNFSFFFFCHLKILKNVSDEI